ncbi:trigger factor [Methylogaea oryzae]|uniref:Trigger factor n=1 Tax=Methylogaea oryzae TaxID=1295382 RepID=A0A8D4VRQ6_9GAMM|nr:trigger factor [Methylogaea oryzae]BBL71170.1 trigger factor [Methylogaea oryzae]
MQVSVQTTSELGRKLTVEVPEELIQEKVAARLKSVARDARIDGFRPGKAPQAVVVKRFGARVREEVMSDMVYSSFQEALKGQQLRPAGMPRITPKSTAEGQGLAYDAEFEVYPEVNLAPLENLAVKNPVSEIADKDLDAMVQRLREQRKTWQVTDRAAQQGDRVTLNFEGSEGGVNFTNGVTENFVAVLGSKQLLGDFEKQLEGKSAGDHLEFDMTFPADYGHAPLAGKTAQFRVDLLKVEESRLPEVDAEFAKAYGIENGDIEAFRRDVRENMEREMERVIQGRQRNSVMDALYNANPILLPEALVADEIEQMMAPYRQSAQQRQQPFDEEGMRPRLEQSARRRVALGLILGEVIKRNELRVDSARVRALVESIGHSYQQPEAAIQWYYAKPERLREVEHRVLEDQAVELVMSKAKVTPENIPFDELMKVNASEHAAV